MDTIISHPHGNLYCSMFNLYSPTFRSLRPELQKHVVMYTMDIFFTTVALAVELAAFPMLAGHFELWMIQIARMSGFFFTALYCFELI